jgi:hypothetical protein
MGVHAYYVQQPEGGGHCYQQLGQQHLSTQMVTTRYILQLHRCFQCRTSYLRSKASRVTARKRVKKMNLPMMIHASQYMLLA